MSIIFFFNDTATTEIYTLSLHDALPICSRRPGYGLRDQRRRPGSLEGRGSCRFRRGRRVADADDRRRARAELGLGNRVTRGWRSEEHTSELQSRLHLVCRLLLEKKKLML